MGSKENKKEVNRRKTPIVSKVFSNGVLLETVYDAEKKCTAFAIWNDGTWHIEQSFKENGTTLVPYSPRNNLIQNDIVLFPSLPEEYESEKGLIEDISAYIHKYVDVSPVFERIASYYVLLSWVYDSFNELPYLRLRGDYGSGKTRFLLVVGSLCYKPIFSSGASTVSPIFHILDAFGGTLIVDEGDLRFSDATADMVKILNNGNVKGIPVLRCEVSGKGEYNPRAFRVFGPKIVATRGYYKDRALESRFITEEMGERTLRDDIPINLPSAYKEEALHLRNKLLMFRFKKYGTYSPKEEYIDRGLEPRLSQIFTPLLSIIDDPSLRDDLLAIAREYNKDILVERGMDTEARVLGVLKDITEEKKADVVGIKDITSRFSDRFGLEYEKKITNKWIGSIVRQKLKLRTHKSHGIFVISPEQAAKLTRLYEKYDITNDAATSSSDGYDW